ncbi:MAG TPA: ABC transporter permease [Steroidobacteraceae bacterium]|nr:ABC transporter permease [Steroidobacteraceae bacterium]
MAALWTVLCKELLENLRDRRTLFSALIFGPLLGPLLFGAMVSRIVAQNAANADRPITLTVVHGDRAPNLMHYLAAAGVKVRPATLSASGARRAIDKGDAKVVLLVPRDYAARFTAGTPARIELMADSADNTTRDVAARAHALLAAYGSAIAQLRLQARGVDPLLALPVAVDAIDVATPAGRAIAVIGFMTYFVLFALLMGGLYLAIDASAGERERGSLEALLTLPVPRAALVGGKILATSVYMCISLAITLSAFVGIFRLLPLARLGMSADVGWTTALAFFAICLPFVPLGAALMTFVASFTRSYREAQSYLAAVLLVPTLPIAFASIYSLKPNVYLMLIPSLSQHLLMTSLLEGRPVAAIDVLLSAGASLALAAALFLWTQRQWRNESMLG